MMMLLTVKRGGKNSPQSLLLSDGHYLVNETIQVQAHKYLYSEDFKHVDYHIVMREMVQSMALRSYL